MVSLSSVAHSSSPRQLVDRYLSTRGFSAEICEPLEVEDYVIQSMPDVSPTRWHLAHTTWFFETFVLKPFVTGYVTSNDAFEYLFNSYYNAVGEQFPRAKRGVLSRPTVREVWSYRDHVDGAMQRLLEVGVSDEIASVVEIGLHHEQQHQELMLTDIKHVLSCNPLYPKYSTTESSSNSRDQSKLHDASLSWIPFAGGVRPVGFNDAGFCFDNEQPRHDTLLQDYSLQDRLVTNQEFLEFINAGGYERPEHWLSMGWATVRENQWKSPLYWISQSDEWYEFTLSGLRPLDPSAPVCHVSYFEADAFARWSGHRLPTEFEWENAVASQPIAGHFAESERFHPLPAATNKGSLRQHYGDVWEWTSSAYAPYPGYAPAAGALGEYNGKFMCNQFVLRGGSCVTSQSHIRATYRNFFPPEARWQFTGIRLAK